MRSLRKIGGLRGAASLAWFAACVICPVAVAAGAEPGKAASPAKLWKESPEAALARSLGDSLEVVAVGVNAVRAPIAGVVPPAILRDGPAADPRCRILLVGHDPAAADQIHQAIRWFYADRAAEPWRKEFLLAAVPHAAWTIAPSYPPQQEAYLHKPGVAGTALWRWIGMLGADLVIEVRRAERPGIALPAELEGPLAKLAEQLEGHAALPADAGELAAALTSHPACETGRIPAMRVNTMSLTESLEQLLRGVTACGYRGPSPARRELQRRSRRSPRQVATELAEFYGHDLKQAVYIPAVALIARLQLGELTENAAVQADVEEIVAAYRTGQRDSAPRNGSGLSGHLIFSELAQRTMGERRREYLAVARKAADLGLDSGGRPRAVMPYHVEMSDSLFMGGPILAHVGELTGDTRYFESCLNHLKFMRQLVLRPDGLYRNSPLDEAAWGRGNGFPALGLALCLEHWPETRPDQGELLAMLRAHLKALKPHQDATGCWHQVIDQEDTYRELTSTCMITFAAARGIRRGWLDRDEFAPLVQRGWAAIAQRVGPNGRLVDVCTGTGKQRTLDGYYQRRAILGPDPRGGAMALLVAVELAQPEHTQPEPAIRR